MRIAAVLGVSDGREDAAAALLVDGRPVAAAGEAELGAMTAHRLREEGALPERAIGFGLSHAGLTLADVSTLAVADTERWADDSLCDPSTTELSELLAAGTRRARIVQVSAGHAAAALAAATVPGDVAARLIVLDGSRLDAGAIFRRRGGDGRGAGPGVTTRSGDGASPDTRARADESAASETGARAGAGVRAGGEATNTSRLRLEQPIAGAGRLMEAVRATGLSLGLAGDEHVLDALAELSASDAPDDGRPLRELLQWDSGEVRLDLSALGAYLDRVQASLPASLAHRDHPHLAVQRARRLVAATFVDQLTTLIADIVRDAGARRATSGATDRAAVGQSSTAAAGGDARRSGAHAPATAEEPIAFGGGLFTSPRFNSQLATRLGGAVTFSPVPEPVGLALGAALALTDGVSDAGHGNGAPLAHVGLGPAFSEDDIKATLENCRIDFVYEPSWQRLLMRTSGLLARGKVIAWFQGPLDFGPRSLGSRSILCDPSNRYARHNVNEYLLGRALDAPLAVSLPADGADEYLDEALHSPFMLRRGQFRDAWIERVRSALDGARGCTVHTVGQAQSAELRDLLALHHDQTGVPGLIHHPLRAGAGHGPLTATPRAALQAFYSSAIDAMVIGRFLLMKDYWLLRSES